MRESEEECARANESAPERENDSERRAHARALTRQETRERVREREEPDCCARYETEGGTERERKRPPCHELSAAF